MLSAVAGSIYRVADSIWPRPVVPQQQNTGNSVIQFPDLKRSVRRARPLLKRLFGGEVTELEISRYQAGIYSEAARVYESAINSGSESIAIWGRDTAVNMLRAAGIPAGVLGTSQRATDPFPFIGYSRRFPSRAYRLPKLSPVNLRTFSETPVPRHAINKIKNEIRRFRWEVRPKHGIDWSPELETQAAIVRNILERPNDDEEPTWGTLHDKIIEDLLLFGAWYLEARPTPADNKRPMRLWAVASESMQINPNWLGSPLVPRFAQVIGYAFGIAVATGQHGYERDFLDSEIVFGRYNPRTTTPFGLGPLEVAFSMVNFFLSANDQAGRTAGNEVASFLIDLGRSTPQPHVEAFRHYWEDMIEGQGKVPIIGGIGTTANAQGGPEGGVKIHPFPQAADPMRVEWQNFLIRIIGMAFQLSAMKMNLERDVNRSTAEVLDDADFTSAIQPVADSIADTLTVDLIQKKLGFSGLEFRFIYPQNEEKVARVFSSYAGIIPVLLEKRIFSVETLREHLGRNIQDFDPKKEAARIAAELADPALDKVFNPEPGPEGPGSGGAFPGDGTGVEPPDVEGAIETVPELPGASSVPDDLMERIELVKTKIPKPAEKDGRLLTEENATMPDSKAGIPANPSKFRDPYGDLEDAKGFIIPEPNTPDRLALLMPEQLTESQKQKLRNWEMEWKAAGEPERREAIGKEIRSKALVRALRSLGVENPWAVARWIAKRNLSLEAAGYAFSGPGAIIALWLPLEQAEKFAIPGGIPADEMRVTLCHLGGQVEFDNGRLNLLREKLSRIASEKAGRMSVRVNGLARFEGIEDGARDALVALVSSPELDALRAEVAEAAREIGIVDGAEHGFIPHVTITYLAPGEKSPVEKLPAQNVVFDGMSLSYGGTREIFPFSGIERG